MNPYEKKRRWKLFLLAFAAVIGAASVFYSDFFVKKMEREERIQFELWVKGTEKSSQIFEDALYAEVLNMITSSSTVPVILTDTTGTKIETYLRLDSTKTNYVDATSKATYDPGYFQRELSRMKKQHAPLPINYMGRK
ncbi:MAG TPA: hypothetical protein VNZ46_18760, partial [Pedobacter sp.]|nr:hypothetical protein [Pedobacter sp.]